MKKQLGTLRAEQGWSQSELAERVGVSRQTIHAIESGKYDPSLPLAFKLAEVFDRLIEQLFEPEKENRIFKIQLSGPYLSYMGFAECPYDDN